MHTSVDNAELDQCLEAKHPVQQQRQQVHVLQPQCLQVKLQSSFVAGLSLCMSSARLAAFKQQLRLGAMQSKHLAYQGRICLLVLLGKGNAGLQGKQAVFKLPCPHQQGSKIGVHTYSGMYWSKTYHLSAKHSQQVVCVCVHSPVLCQK